MPIIQAYRGNNSIIPVVDATVVDAYQSRWDSRVFATREEYSDYILARRAEVHQRVVHERSAAKMAAMRTSTKSFDDLIEWVADNQEYIGIKLQHLTRNKKYVPKEFEIEITYVRMDRALSVSNSHSAPIGGERNWHREPGRPLGYPAWHGSIEFTLSGHYGMSGGEIGSILGFYTGSGGSGNGTHYGYECIFWEADWPGLSQYSFLNKLSDNDPDMFIYGRPARY
jgi:hypothetical protein